MRMVYDDTISVPLTSTSIASLAYSPSTGCLDIVFRRRSRYRYSGIPPLLFAAFVASPSKGRFFHAYIRDRFPYRPMRDPRRASPAH